jgi:hypothetical protein
VIAWPRYLMSAGIVLIILGCLWAALSRLNSGRPHIHPKMSNKRIREELRKEQRIPFGGWVMLLGCLLLLTGIGWRLARSISWWVR